MDPRKPPFPSWISRSTPPDTFPDGEPPLAPDSTKPAQTDVIVPTEVIHYKAGAPLGNTNARKHGFYSHTFTPRENKRLEGDVRGELRDEEEFLRILLARTAEHLKGRELGPEEYWVAFRAVALAVGRVESLHRSRKQIYENQTSLEKVWEELKTSPSMKTKISSRVGRIRGIAPDVYWGIPAGCVVEGLFLSLFLRNNAHIWVLFFFYPHPWGSLKTGTTNFQV